MDIWKFLNAVREKGSEGGTPTIFPYEALQEAIRTRDVELQKERDLAWIQAMAAALGTDSGFKIPIVPEAAPFRDLFAELRRKIFEEVQAACDAEATYSEGRAKHYMKRAEEPHVLTALDRELATSHLRDRETVLRVKAALARMEKP